LAGFSVSRSISEPLSNDAANRASASLHIINAKSDPVAVPEVELGKIAVKVPLGTVLIDAGHPALEDREKAFDGVGVRIAAYPFL
jgi:hypothetical protein